ncbi:DUF5689 domain-containing protein [Aquimarina sp. 2201CG5-10]|uniref:DUF5689 domain-containing protein n=1 Tax=Aquimarina callyspongiae TaxID=3098150 RepID=UPI002AB487F6|nr:DUF5689 domain-containing protein [Aquimarina sp. 2201CG5-10]MDY8135298.1 DUF5689 domain-containing protein [Aquimarina sp. 2201CG5-10]
MNSSNLIKFLSVLMIAVTFTACVEDDDFNTPPLVIEEPNIPANNKMGVDAVLGILAQEIADENDPDAKVTFESNDMYMEGYVVSTDKSGNFFEELIIQDRAENPTGGVRVLIDVNPLFTTYEFGRRVFVKLDGLSVGIENGVPTLGVLAGDEVDQIPSFSQNEVITRSSETVTITPLEIAFEDFSDDLVNVFIKVNDVQFNKDAVLGNNPLTFSGEPTDEFDGERTLESCATGATAILSTSTFADFKGLRLPAQRGSFEGVLTKNFFGDTFNLVLNGPTGLVFDNAERCDPIELTCGIAATVGATNLFSDDFETQSVNSIISGNGWTNYQQAGTETWEAYTSGGTNASLGISARVGSFNSGDASTIAWLITPQIDLDAQEGETLRFQTSNSFSDGSNLDLLFSKDWDGNPDNIASATWGIITDATIVQDSDFFGDWIESGNVDLSCESGQIYIAFRYTGSGDSDFDGTFELDEISIDAN